MDGVKVYRTQKAWIYSYSSALSKGPVLQSKMVLAVVREATLAKPKTHDQMGKVIGWICECLQRGIYPSSDFRGKPFETGSQAARKAGSEIIPGWRFCFSGFKGDLEARVVIHKFPRNYMANAICEHCPAGRKSCFFQDFRPQAPYRSLMFTHAHYLMMTPEHKLSSWLHVPGWTKDRNLEDLQLFCFLVVGFVVKTNLQTEANILQCFSSLRSCKDLLHTLHQGVACCSIAALLLDHLESAKPGLTLNELETGLQGAYFHYRRWCCRRGLSGASLQFTLARFGKEKWAAVPELTTQYKASAVKVMMFWVTDYLHEHMHAAPAPGSQRRWRAAYTLAMFQNTLDISGPWLDDATRKEAAENGFAFLLLYQRLAKDNRARTDGRQNYKITPKFHSFLHMLLTIQKTGRNARLLDFLWEGHTFVIFYCSLVYTSPL